MGQLPNRQPNFWITEIAFNKLVGNYGLCQIQDLNNADARSVQPFLGGPADTVSVFTSGFIPDQTDAAKVAGIDRIRHEMNPSAKERKLNVELNVYHYAVGRPSPSGLHSGEYPVWQCNPISNQSIAPHWPTVDLNSVVRMYIADPSEHHS